MKSKFFYMIKLSKNYRKRITKKVWKDFRPDEIAEYCGYYTKDFSILKNFRFVDFSIFKNRLFFKKEVKADN